MGSIFDYAVIPFNKKSVKDLNLWFDHVDRRLSRDIKFYVPRKWSKRANSEPETPKVCPGLQRLLKFGEGYSEGTKAIMKQCLLGSICYNLIENTYLSYIFSDFLVTSDLLKEINFHFFNYRYEIIVVPVGGENGIDYEVGITSNMYCGLELPSPYRANPDLQEVLHTNHIEVVKQQAILKNQLQYFTGIEDFMDFGLDLLELNDYPVYKVGTTVYLKLFNNVEYAKATGTPVNINDMGVKVKNLNWEIPLHTRKITSSNTFKNSLHLLAQAEMGSILIRKVAMALLGIQDTVVVFEFN
jgi:hypothetical protein